MAAQVNAKVALTESKLVPRWAKLGSRQPKVIPSCPYVGHNCCQIDSRWLQCFMKAERANMHEKQMTLKGFSYFLCLSWCHYGSKLAQVDCTLAEVGSRVSLDGSSWHQDRPSWCQRGLKMVQVAASIASRP